MTLSSPKQLDSLPARQLQALPTTRDDSIPAAQPNRHVINDYDALRELYGQLLMEIQRIKSEGDYETGSALVETYGVKVDQAI